MNANALSVEGLTAGYGKIIVVRDLSFTVARGEIVALLGRNGAGKTTTLLAIAGYLSHTGTVRIGDTVAKGPAYRRTRGDIGIVLEGRSVFPSLSVRQNLSLARVPADRATEMFPELTPHLARKAGGLSGGEQQMLSIARALGRDPRVLLIDEVVGLAPVVCERIFARLREVATLAETAIVLVEQHLHNAAEVADRAIVISEGTKRLEVPGDEIERRADEIEQIYLGTAMHVST